MTSSIRQIAHALSRPKSGSGTGDRRARKSKVVVALGRLLLAASLAAAPSLALAQATTWSNGQAVSYTVPVGVTQLSVKMAGAGGGKGGADDNGFGGDGGAPFLITAVLNVTPGQVITGTTGKRGANGGRSAEDTVLAGSAGGSGVGSGGSGGATGRHDHSGSGAGGGGGTSLILAGTSILNAAGGGGGQGGSWDVSGLSGGNATAVANPATCASGNGGTGASVTGNSPSSAPRNPNTNDGGGGGGGGGGHSGGAGGGFHFDGLGGGPASQGGTSCISNKAGLFANTTAGNENWGSVGYVIIDVIAKAPTLSLQKALGGSRIASDDQFSLSGTGTGAPAAIDTTGTGSNISSAAYSFTATAGTSYTLDEAMASGSASTLAQYSQTVGCSNTGPTNVSGFTTLPITVTPIANDAISCVVTNTPKAPTLSLQKTLGGSRIATSDQFTLSGAGTGAPAAVTTTGSGSTVSSAAYSFTATAGTNYALNEAMAPGSTSTLAQYSQTVNCTNPGPTNVSGLTTLPITVTPVAGDAISCVVTNTPKNTDPDPGGSDGGAGQGSDICNADPIIAGSDFTNSAWIKQGPWEATSANRMYLKDDNGDASLIQNVDGVTPGAIVTFTWRYGDGIISSGYDGNQSRVLLYYGGGTYWRGLTSDGPGTAPASSALNGATCISGCGALGPSTNRVVKIRLPAGIPSNGTLQFRAQEFGGTSDDPEIRGPISIANTGICLIKKSLGGTGTFDFSTTGVDTSMGDGGTTASVTTSAANADRYYDASSTRVNNQPLLVKNPGPAANVTITETPAANFVLDSVSCQGVTPTRSGNSISIANVPRDTVATCTFTNRTSIISLSKALGGHRYADADNFSVAIRTGSASGTVVSSTTNATTTGSGATVTAGTGTTGDFYTTPGTSYFLTEAGTSGANLANYNAKLTCTDSAGVTPAASLPTSEVFDPAAGRMITPATGANLRCVITNTPKNARIFFQKALGDSGRIAAGDQFRLSGSGSGAPAAVNTTGSGTQITSPAYSLVAIPGSTYVLNEAMAAGSASLLQQYNQIVRCTNTGTTNVSTLSALPITVTPAEGDAISCVVTNTPKGSGDPGQGSTACNADPIIAGSNFTNQAWNKTGTWDPTVDPTWVSMTDDNGDAVLHQYVTGVTPGALLNFTWSFREGLLGNGAPNGKRAEVHIYYNSVLYWTGLTSSGSGAAPASNAKGGASCVSGCSSTLAPGTKRTVQLRLPVNIPRNAWLQFQIRALEGRPSDDPYIYGPVSIANTGICLVKNSRGSTGPFHFTTTGLDTTMGGGGTTASITTAAAYTPTYYDASSTRSHNQPLLVLNPGSSANVTIEESPGEGFVLEDVSCAGVTPVRSGNSISIADVPRDTVATCTFTNRTAIINLSKALGSPRFAPGDNFSVAIRTGTVDGEIVSSTATATATTTGTGATVTAGTGTTGDFYSAPGTSYFLTEAGESGADLANYNAQLSCTDSTGVTPAADLPANEPFNPAAGRLITPLTGANLQCVITNTPGGPRLVGKVILDNGAGGGGIAHDAVQNGAETGRAGVTIRLTDCGSAEYASTVTDSGGDFAFSLASVSVGTVCLVKQPSTAYVPVSANPGTTGGTYMQSNDTLQFTVAADTAYFGIVLGEVPASRLLIDGLKQAMPGTIVTYAHTFDAGTSASVTFSTANAASGWTSQLYLDNDCDAQLGSGDTSLSSSVTVAAGQTICLLNRVSVPAGAPEGAQNVTTVSAVETLTPVPTSGPLSFNHSRTDTTTVGQSSLTLTKEVRRLPGCPASASASMGNGAGYTTINEAESGDALEYRIGYRNDTSVAVTQVRITDAVPAYTLFQDAWCLTTPPDGIASCSVVSMPPANAGSGSIIWELQDAGPPAPGLGPGAQGAVSFCVLVEN